MGASYSAQLVLGCVVDVKVLQTRVKGEPKTSRGCSHSVPDAQKFCAECGKPRLTTTEPEDLYVPDYVEAKYPGKGGMRWACTTDDNQFVVGVVLVAVDVGDYANELVNVSGHLANAPAKGEIQKRLEPNGLWFPKQFGLWLVGNCCY